MEFEESEVINDGDEGSSEIPNAFLDNLLEEIELESVEGGDGGLEIADLPDFEESLKQEDGAEGKRADRSAVLEKNYPRLFLPTYINDILANFGTDLCLVEGESLLLFALSRDDVDWTRGGEPLHLFYCVEQLLLRLKERGATIEIIFFKNGRSLWPQELYTLRQLLIHHLKRHSPFPVFSGSNGFDSWCSPSFKSHFDEEKPTFCVFFDPTNLPQSFRGEDSSEKSDKPKVGLERFSSKKDVSSRYLVPSIVSCICEFQTPVVLFPIDFGVNTAEAFVITYEVTVKNRTKKIIEEIVREILGTQSQEAPLDKEKTKSSFLESVSSLKFAFKYGERMILSCTSLKSIFASLSNEEKELAKLYLVHLFFLEHLALCHRAFPLIPHDVNATLKKNNKYLPLITGFCKKVLQAAFPEHLDVYLEDADPLEEETLLNNSCDLYSGGLLDALCRSACKEGDGGIKDAKNLGLSDSVCDELSKVWSWVAGATPLYPLLPASGQTKEEGEVLSQLIHKPSPPQAIAPVQVALFDEFLTLTAELVSSANTAATGLKEIKDAEQPKTESKKEAEEEEQVDSWEDIEEDAIVLPQKTEPKPVQEIENTPEQVEPQVQVTVADKPFSDVYLWHSGKEFFVNEELFLSGFEIRMMVRVRERMRGTKLTKAEYPTKLSDLSPPERVLLDKVRLKNKQKLGRFEQRYIESLEGYTMNLQKMIVQKAPVVQSSAPAAAAGKKKAEKKEKETTQKVSATSARLREENALAQEEKARKSAEDKAVQIKEMATDVFALQKFISNPNTPSFTVLLLLIEKLRLCQVRVENGTSNTQDYIVMVEALQKIYTDFFRATGENKKHIGYIKEMWVKGLCVVARNLGFTKAADFFDRTWKEDIAAVNAPAKAADTKKAGGKGAKGKKEKDDKGKAAAKAKAKGKAKAAAKGGKKEDDSDDSDGSDWEEAPVAKDDNKKKEPEVSPETVNKYIKMTPIRFQLKHMSHILLRRETPPERDDRVKFAPDAWQKELLDIVDKKESALICAPTSSGKTFACFYAMEQVLTEDDEGVVVYVAPTKALVNQTVADTEARLRKNYSHGGRVMSGYFTKDYRKDILTCQVLITVPACLEVLLLSPTHFEWRQRLRYIIFDEFHCIDSATDGGIWERLFQLISCPFLALSATVGNPEPIRGWLEKLQTRPVHLVSYGERYSDLKKWDFLPSTTSASCWDDIPAENLTVHPAFKGKNAEHLFSTDALMPIHPASLLASLPSVAFPADMRLSAEECLTLYDTMAAAAGKDWAGSSILKPEKFFAECPFVSRKEARRYEEELKKELMSWDLKKKESVHQILNGPPATGEVALDPHKVFVLLGKELEETRKKQDIALPDSTSPTSFQFVRDNILNLLLVLSEKEMLPCIVFCYDRAMCEKLASKLLEQLERKQKEKDNNRYAELRKHWNEYERKKKKEKRSRDEDEKKKNVVNKEEGFKEVLKAETGVGDPDIVMPAEIDPDFTFLLPGSTIDIPETLVQMAAADASGMGIKFMDLVKRGIGIHHSGLPKKSRQVVEMLFRQKYLRVVIATGTLSLGINMPCRSVVFATDSLYVNPLEFRQASGRAGRRGFDDLGNVVFCGFTPGRISHLMTAPVPIIRGKFSLSTTEVLRLLMQYNTLTTGNAKGDQKELQAATLQAAKRVISHPLLAVSLKEADFNSVFLEFALQVLFRCRLIDNKGVPVNFAGLVAHLYYFEPSNLAFSWLIQHGYFQKFANQNKKGVNAIADLEIYKQLLLVVANIFNRRFVHKTALERVAADNWRSPSKVVLEKMHPIFQEGLNDYNNTLKQLAFTFLSKFAQKKLGSVPDNILPLSSPEALKFRWEDNQSAFANNPATVAGALRDSCLVYHCRSAFGALSGKGDQWDSLGDLANSLRSGIPFIVSSLPIFEQQNERSLNRFIVDFWSHGQVAPLSKANCMRLGEVWNEINDAHKLLQSISNALDKLQETASHIVSPLTSTCFKDIEAEFNEKFRAAFQMK